MGCEVDLIQVPQNILYLLVYNMQFFQSYSFLKLPIFYLF
jgi:hypothetical protein